MNQSSDDLFTYAGLAGDEDGGPRSSSDPGDLLAQTPQLRRGADQAFDGLELAVLGGEDVHRESRGAPTGKSFRPFRPLDPWPESKKGPD